MYKSEYDPEWSREDNFLSGKANGRHELSAALSEWAASTNDSRVIEIIASALYQVTKND